MTCEDSPSCNAFEWVLIPADPNAPASSKPAAPVFKCKHWQDEVEAYGAGGVFN